MGRDAIFNEKNAKVCKERTRGLEKAWVVFLKHRGHRGHGDGERGDKGRDAIFNAKIAKVRRERTRGFEKAWVVFLKHRGRGDRKRADYVIVSSAVDNFWAKL